MLRTILWQCFGLRSASFYPSDFANNPKLESYTGHIEFGPERERYLEGPQPLLKTHEQVPLDANPTIYVVRDGRAAIASTWKFYGGQIPLNALIDGNWRFGPWSGHVQAWNPWRRPQTLLIRYEDIQSDFAKTLAEIAAFLRVNSLQGACGPGHHVRRNVDTTRK